MAGTGPLFALLCLTSAAVLSKSEVPSPFEGPQDDILQSLNHLHETLLNQSPCEDRLDKIWKRLAEHSTITGEKIKEVLGFFNDLGPVLAMERGGGCLEKFKKAGNHCLYTYTNNRWPWWRSRFFCWLLGAEMVNPEDLPQIKQFLPAENHKFWIGGHNADESQRFPVWKSVYGKRIWSDQANFTSIPRDSPKANCLAADGNDEHRFQALDCEDKIMTVCQQRYKD